MCQKLHLGSLLLQRPISGISASVTTNASIAPDIPDFSSKPPYHLRSHLDSLWVKRGKGFSLVFGVNLIGYKVAQIDIESIRETLETAQLWSQLHLRATVSAQDLDTGFPTSQESSFVVRVGLHHADDPALVPFQGCHKILSEAASKMPHPPLGVPVHEIRVVSFAITISRENVTVIKYDGISHEFGYRPTEPECASDPVETVSEQEEIAFTNELTPDDMDLFQDLEDNRRKSGTAPECIQLRDIIDIFDSAIRLTICNRPKRLSPDIKVERRQQQITLSKLSPALWSPGFLSAMRQRSVLLPRIDHALSDQSGMNNNGFEFKSGPLLSSYHSPSQSYKEQSASRNDPQPGEYSKVSIQLWHHLQKELRNNKSAETLCPLRTVEIPEEEYGQEGTLFESQDCGPHIEIPFADGLTEELAESAEADQDFFLEHDFSDSDCEDTVSSCMSGELFELSFNDDLWRQELLDAERSDLEDLEQEQEVSI
ncbi:hypothetical protein BDY21DRAFT_332699 [Lineolata rhizophorae]|uniref:Uncharacterized protein n=1 Tax=Lineolata rhizophorae TaxID=578093 RepID=A0A6A6PCA9_9PEZI|nr:hypothetical protein BDY21DRAFT_332699 [Lineolata rhizophorae]